MTPYDSFDYPLYWQNREYEHKSEEIAIKSLLKQVGKPCTILEIGGGHGRLISCYEPHAKKIIFSEPSQKLLAIAHKKNGSEKIRFIQSTLENLKFKIKKESVDLVILVRVIHHLENLSECFCTINKLLKPKGYFVLEFANKGHFKASMKELVKGNFTYCLDISHLDLRRNKSSKGLPFYNFHPDKIEMLLIKEGFKIVEKRSVSNIRNRFIKKIIPTRLSVAIERSLQSVLSSINFGPSIFILAQKGT